MKRSSPKPQDDGKISLFPFLAVLLCMMGSLLVLLIIVSQRAQAAAQEEQAAQNTPSPAEVKQAAENAEKLKAHVAALREVRDKLAQRMTSDRQVLSHLEDHARRLRDDVQRMQAEAKLLAQTQSKQGKLSKESLTEAKRVEQLAEEAARLLEESRKPGAKKPSYSVIPYDGPNPTRRRPIYLECHADSVVIQPEGIVLHENDFDEPLGPDNPLAVALRAASEYLARHSPDPSAGVPYPLLIVRPSSIRAYYAVRAALQSWGEDFGYEMVDEEWKINYIPPDPQLTGVLESSVGLARRRMELERSMAGRGRGHGSGGGVGGGGGDYVGGTEDPGSAEGAHPGMRGVPRVRNASAAGGNGIAGDVSGGSQQGGASDGQATGQNGASGSMRPTYPGGGGSQAGYTHRGSQQTATGRGGAENGTSGQSQPGGASGQSGGGSPSTTADTNRPARLGESFVPTAGTSSGSRSTKTNATAAADGGSGGGEAFGSTKQGEGSAEGSLAKSRGKNWALPSASQGSVGVTRPLRVEVAADRIVIDSGNPSTAKQSITCVGSTDAVVEQFVSTVWEQMRGWGIAGRGMYWRPVLNLHVLPGGQQRAAELKRLLDGSGLDVKLQP
ncbi:MAG: hypothetical protein K8T91_15205 [Planctomycetes bacterium]|nr:hypothetical protein [Planctomycetota bacterium]